MENMLLEVGNERMPGHSSACPGDDCVEAHQLRVDAAHDLVLDELNPAARAVHRWAELRQDGGGVDGEHVAGASIRRRGQRGRREQPHRAPASPPRSSGSGSAASDSAAS